MLSSSDLVAIIVLSRSRSFFESWREIYGVMSSNAVNSSIRVSHTPVYCPSSFELLPFFTSNTDGVAFYCS